MALEPVDTTTTDADTYKGNDIDDDGDGVVDSADSASDADTVDGKHASELGGISAVGYSGIGGSMWTVYQNTTGYPVQLVITVDAETDPANARVVTDSSSSPSDTVAYHNEFHNRVSILVIVPDGHYWKVEDTNDTTSIYSVDQMELR